MYSYRDVFVSKGRPFDRQANLRKRKEALDERREFSFYLSSPEDTILYKLEWYKTGGGVSERQWNDLVGVIKVQKHNLDKKYLLKWANELEVTNLLKRALIESGFEEDK